MSKSTSDLLFADFDSRTQWPPSDKMPADFDWQQIMEIGKDPGLGIRTLHDQGITGQNVGIAIIDQTLLVDHIEYSDRLRLYEEPEQRDRGMAARMHGPAVASIAVGTTVGVATEADLYYIAAPLCFENNDFSCLARSVRRVIEINRTIPAEHKIRVLAIARGWDSVEFGYDDIMTAVKEASAEGIFVISSSLSETHGLNFHGLGRSPLSDPNDVWSYEPGLWWQDRFYIDGFYYSPVLLVPMDSRTTASPTGAEDYVFYRQGGWSWSIPYLAGMYALAVQAKPDITPEEFWSTALSTGETIHIGHNGKDYEFGIILDPQELIEAIKTK
ncbi:MAG TPA: S8/S53 family peptidase [Anaerolineales bacterium]|nr:S8/S53 family peptidase [Anaerolineales bacterium]